MINLNAYNPQNGPKRILLRAGFDPLKKYNPCDFFAGNLVGDNLGNLLFAYGAMNVLWTENSSIKQIYDKPHYSDEDIAFINSNFDVFIMPMADAFRHTYLNQLRSYTSLISKLKIPVIILGIGYRTTYEPQFNIDSELDSVVIQFVKTVLEHSSKLGLRGEITGQHLSKLGFKEERDFIPIGCPSLYTYGNNLHSKRLPSFDEIKRGKLIFNANTWAKDHFGEFIPFIDRFILDVVNEIPNHFLIQQKISEFKHLYFGSVYSSRKKAESLFSDGDFYRMHKDDRVKCFISVPSWVKFCQDADLFVGNRFHGAVAAILAGTPHIFLPFDGRTRELSEYHHFTSISPDCLKKETNLFDCVNTLDFYSFDKNHDENFRRYINFLEKNELNHIFQMGEEISPGMSPMEKNIKYTYKPIHCMESLSLLGKTKRTISCFPYFINRAKSYIH